MKQKRITIKPVGRLAFQVSQAGGKYDLHVRWEKGEWILDKFRASEKNTDRAYVTTLTVGENKACPIWSEVLAELED